MIEEFDRVWSEHQVHPLEPVSLITALCTTPKEAHALTVAWKMSNMERKLATFVATHRLQAQDPKSAIKSFQDFLVDGVQRSHVVQLLHYAGQHDKAKQMEDFVIPVFPVNGTDLKAIGLKPGPEYGRILGILRNKWKEEYYTSTKKDLIESLTKSMKFS